MIVSQVGSDAPVSAQTTAVRASTRRIELPKRWPQCPPDLAFQRRFSVVKGPEGIVAVVAVGVTWRFLRPPRLIFRCGLAQFAADYQAKPCPDLVDRADLVVDQAGGQGDFADDVIGHVSPNLG